MNRWFCKIIKNSENKYHAVMQIEGRNIYDLEENVDYKTLKKSIEDKTGIRILQCKNMIFEKLSNTEKVATIDCTQSREDCRVTMEELLNGWKPAWEEQSIKIIKEENKINDIKKLADKYQENYDNSKDYTIVYKNDGIKVNDFNFSATKDQETELINNYKNSELRKYISFEVFVYNYVKENYNNKPENNIIETIKKFKWKLTQIWVENNCIFADVEKPNGNIEQEGLYAVRE